MRKWLPVFLLMISLQTWAQKDVTTFGLQIKPIIPSNLFRAGEETLLRSNFEYSVEQRLGYSFGGVIRRGFTDWFTMETGISAVRRNFTAGVGAVGGSQDTTGFSIVGYEIPVLGMVYVKLSDKIYMDAAFGLSLDMFPRSVGSTSDSKEFRQFSIRRRWLQTGLLANVGWEYRTKQSGYFYIGASYHRPFQTIYLTRLEYLPDANENYAEIGITGNYLTIDLRYFFHSDPEKRKKKEKKRDKSTMPQWMQR